MRDGKTPGKPPDQDVSPLALAGLGTQFAVALLAFAYAGQWLDNRWHSSPACLLIGVFLGGGGTFFVSYKRLMKGTAVTRDNGGGNGSTGSDSRTGPSKPSGGEE
jgi:hypothetical protein